MDFGIFSMFSTREGRSQSQTFQEWFDIVQVAEDLGLDTFWLGESHFRPNRAVLASPLIGASAIEPMNIAGLCEPAKRNWYAVDVNDGVRHARKLGVPESAVIDVMTECGILKPT